MFNLLNGLTMGLANGLSPGPLMTLVISQTMRFNFREGLKISLTPIIGGIPVILISIWVYKALSHSHVLLGCISLFGCGFLFVMGVSNLRVKAIESQSGEVQRASLMKGTLATLLNPAPYAFWISVGAPLAIQSVQSGLSEVLGFLTSFFVALVGSNVLVALTAAYASRHLKASIFLWVVRILGVLLIVYACLFLRNGLLKLGLT